MINYKLIDESISFYDGRGFKRIESPWTVTKAIANITKPSWAQDWTILEKNKVLVASGEQSFLCLYNKGFLPLGKFQTVTPCFRDDEFDELHTKYFIKNELIVTDKVNYQSLCQIICDVKDFFSRYIPRDEIELINTGEYSRDLQYKGIELGSYGIRECSFLKWIYGTGIAEPRFSRTLE